MDIKEHYENHLANYYSWMFGDFNAKLNENQRFFECHNIKPVLSKTAIDLGAGCGFQSIPLAKIGFKVKAIDFSKKLLDELKSKSNGLSIEAIEDNILDFDVYSNCKPELIVCMGDTITHLDSLESIQELIKNNYKILLKSGKLILTFRDSTLELKEEQRFIPVRSDDNRIFTCFLEYHYTYVKVFDIIYEKENGRWIQKISSYKKLVIPRNVIEDYFEDAGFKIEFMGVENGLVTIIGTK
ncbi:Ubiquinone biosynthesis O-methyltransferase [uncultured archaeon]|nr:Ubiquinone biosynthesis O-methyltransferase [uncultured archaeon]